MTHVPFGWRLGVVPIHWRKRFGEWNKLLLRKSWKHLFGSSASIQSPTKTCSTPCAWTVLIVPTNGCDKHLRTTFFSFGTSLLGWTKTNWVSKIGNHTNHSFRTTGIWVRFIQLSNGEWKVIHPVFCISCQTDWTIPKTQLKWGGEVITYWAWLPIASPVLGRTGSNQQKVFLMTMSIAFIPMNSAILLLAWHGLMMAKAIRIL